MTRALLVLTLCLPAVAAAAPAGLDADQLALREGILARYADHVEPWSSTRAPAELEHGPHCLMGLVQDVRDNRALFDADEWARMVDGLDILGEQGRLGAGAVAAPPAAPLESPPAAPVESCFGRVGANQVVGEHFVVEWDTSSISQATAEAALVALEDSWDVEIEELNWKTPPGSTGYPILFYISNDNYAGAYTTVDNCSGYGYIPYIVSGRGSFSAGNWYKTMAAHEFNHAIQFGYGYAHEFYYWEATATWIEEYVYPQYNDWADMYVGFPYYPHIAMNASNQDDQEIFYHMYAMGIWASYLDQYHGGHDTVQDTWEEAVGSRTVYDYWMPEVLEDMGLDFGEVFQGFMATTAFMDFEESSSYASVLDFGTAEEVDDLPAEGDTQNDGPQSLGMNYIWFEDGLGGDGKFLQVDFTGLDDSVDWFAVLATGDDHQLDEWVSIPLDGTTGSAWIPLADDQQAFLIVSPMDEDAVGIHYNWRSADEYDYEWQACLVDAETGVPCGEAEPSGDGGGDDAGDDPATPSGDDAGDDGTTSCGCASPAAPLSAGLWLLGALGLGLRRRR